MSVNMPLATNALYILAFGSAAIGMSFGVLLPLVFPGITFGLIFAILIGFFAPYVTAKYMLIVYPIAAVIGCLIGIK